MMAFVFPFCRPRVQAGPLLSCWSFGEHLSVWLSLITRVSGWLLAGPGPPQGLVLQASCVPGRVPGSRAQVPSPCRQCYLLHPTASLPPVPEGERGVAPVQGRGEALCSSLGCCCLGRGSSWAPWGLVQEDFPERKLQRAGLCSWVTLPTSHFLLVWQMWQSRTLTRTAGCWQ